MADVFLTSISLRRRRLFILLNLFSHLVYAQSILNQSPINETAERVRIETTRQQHLADYEKKRKSCYQKIAVTPCQLEARNEKNAQLSDLKRQENALNDLDRKRKGAERVAKIDARSAPEQLLQKNERRAQAMEQSEQRALSLQRRQTDQLNASSAIQSASPSAQIPKKKSRSAQTRSKDRIAKPKQAALTPEEIKQNLARSEQREKDAAERLAKSIQRERDRKKPPSAPLPVPPL